MTATPLQPCPFCGAGETQTRDNGYWTGMRNEIVSVEIIHWCVQLSAISGSRIVMRGKTYEDAAAMWNRRSANSGAEHV